MSTVEYALLACLIAVFCVAMVTAAGNSLLNLFTVVCNNVAGAIGGPAC